MNWCSGITHIHFPHQVSFVEFDGQAVQKLFIFLPSTPWLRSLLANGINIAVGYFREVEIVRGFNFCSLMLQGQPLTPTHLIETFGKHPPKLHYDFLSSCSTSIRDELERYSTSIGALLGHVSLFDLEICLICISKSLLPPSLLESFIATC